MRTWIKRLLTPPVFVGDEDKTRTAFLLHIILLVLLAAAIPFRVLFFLQVPAQPPSVPILWLFIALLLVTFFLLRRGHVRLASLLTIFSIWSVLLASAIINGGMRSTEFNTLFIPVLIAGLLLGRGAALLTVGLSSLAGLAMWRAETAGVMPIRSGTNNSLLLFMVHTIGFLVAAVLVTLAKSRIEAALARVRAELDERKRLEEIQRASRQQYESLVQSIDGIVWEVDAKTFKFTFVSQQAEKILGYPVQQWLAEPNFWANHLHPDDRDWAISFCTAAVEQKENHQFDYRMIAADGRMVWVRDRVTVSAIDEHTLRLRGVMVDITERMKAEEALRLSESRYRKIVELAPEAIVVVDIEIGTFIDFNPQALALFKLSAKEIRTVGPVAMSPPVQPDGRTSREAAQAYLAQALAGATPVFEWLHRDAQGREFLCEVRLLKLPDESRQLIRGTVTDISARKQAEEALRSSEERFAKTFHASPETMAITRARDNVILEVNERWVTNFGFTQGETVGKTAYELKMFDPEGPQAIQAQEFLSLLEGQGSVRDFEVELKTKWGTTRHISLSAERIIVNNEVCNIFLHRDITDQKIAEERLRATMEQLRALTVKLRSAREEEARRIAREIHDELGAALTSLRWELERLDKTIARTQEPSQLQGLRERLAYMLKLTDTTISGIRRIAGELRPSVLDDLGLAEAVEWQAQEFQRRTGIRCICDYELEDLALGLEQSTALFRIVQEALTNVLRHAQATQVEIMMKKLDGEFVLTISDNGRGITAAQQSDPQSLGLLGMRERAHLIGAEIKISGMDGKGTTVTVRVPTFEAAA